MKIVYKNPQVKLDEDGLARIYTHLSDDVDFAIIGSADMINKKGQFSRLLELVRECASKNHNIGWKYLEGTYTYDNDGTTSVERSVIVYNISKVDALRIAKELNQESIIWKDKDFFGFLTADGIADGELGRGMSLDKEKVQMYGSRLLGKHNKAKAFVFEVLEHSIRGSNFSKQNKDTISRYEILRIE